VRWLSIGYASEHVTPPLKCSSARELCLEHATGLPAHFKAEHLVLCQPSDCVSKLPRLARLDHQTATPILDQRSKLAVAGYKGQDRPTGSGDAIEFAWNNQSFDFPPQ
jgi:hypothetical protein